MPFCMRHLDFGLSFRGPSHSVRGGHRTKQVMQELCARADAVCVQKARGIPEDAKCPPPSHAHFVNWYSGVHASDFSSAGAGIVNSVRRSLVRRSVGVQHSLVVEGTASLIRFVQPAGDAFSIVAVPMEPALASEAKLRFCSPVAGANRRAHMVGLPSSGRLEFRRYRGLACAHGG